MTHVSPAAPRALSLAHFAFYRAYLEGPVALDLPVLADLYLNSGKDPRKVRALLRWLQDELAAAARRTGDREAVRLLRLPKSLGAAADPVNMPSLDEFRETVDVDGVYSEEELRALYIKQYPNAVQTRQERRGVRLHTRRLDALRRLQTAVVEAPQLSHALSGWFEPAIAARLEAAGAFSLQQLVDVLNGFGERWYRHVKGLGREGAGRIVRWVEANRTTLGPLSVRVTQPLRSVSRKLLYAERSAVSDIAPLEAMTMPATLDGSAGTNRAPHDRNQTGAHDDLAAIHAWLKLYDPASHTWRAYRTQSERILLWAVLEQGKPLSSLDVSDIAAYRAFLSNIPVNWIGARRTPRWSTHWRPFAGQLSPSSRASAHAVLQAFFQWLTDMRYLDFNAWTGVRKSAEEKEAGRIKAHHALTRAQCDHLLAYVERTAGTATGERARFILMLGMATGLRLSEMCSATLGGLHPRWVDDQLGTAWTLSVIGKRAKRRTVPMTRIMMEALRCYLRARGLNESPEENEPETPLIGRLENEALTALASPALALAFKKIFEGAAGDLVESDPHAAARIGRASTHWLRHTFGTQAIEAGIPLDIVQENLGHASPATTSIYVTTELDRRIRALESMG
ncbi:tyrosine-type recombinase/integrase [Robbsia sp. Bb-Pol-6]|uniref:Tyrosine-type recombinase/integrase n=1 Tax=Robbsia betulipollinis TaxID=2981849 RepID=A0ABT3ZIU7_9BURK|nr:tyrosine-type recombinase/integrase [Robbsia betulipollinis]MCY0386282.1 tyrosine-type recombinase/integrase [Robbsia betulipollinis]